MAYSIRVKNAAGQVTFDPLTNAGRLLGSVSVDTSGSMTVPGFADGVAWAAGQCQFLERPRKFTLSISGTTLSWALDPAPNSPFILIYYGIR